VKEKRRLYGVMKKSKDGVDVLQAKGDALAYNIGKHKCNKVVSMAKEVARRKLGDSLENADGKGELFRVVKQIVRKNKEVVGGGYVKDGNGNLVVDEEKIKETWRQYFEKLSNEEFDWDRASLDKEQAVSGPGEVITCQEVREAMAKVKSGKAAGPSGLVAEMLKAAGEIGVQLLTDLFNAVVKEGKVPADWSKSWVVSVYKVKAMQWNVGHTGVYSY
jgi:hypothetical protein